MIRSEHLNKVYRMGKIEVPALRDVSLEIEEGEFLAIVGSSGSGKSTLMNQIGILDIPTRGDVYIGGYKVSDMNENERARVRREVLGFIFQQFNLIPTFTVLENVEIPMVLQEMDIDERRSRATEILESLELGHRLDYYPGQLSGGQQQRVAIARALVNDPDIILADEPTGNLDTKSGDMVFNILRDLHDRGKTIVVITHDPDLAGRTARSIQLLDGEVV